MPNVFGTVAVGNPAVPYNGATMQAFKASRFPGSVAPAEGTAPPASPDGGPVNSGPGFGGEGAWNISVPTAEPYCVAATILGVTGWGMYNAVFQGVSLNLVGPGTGVLIDRGGKEYNVRNLVVGDGVADDYTGLNNAMTAVHNAGGGLVVIPAGLNLRIATGTLTPPVDVSLESVGPPSVAASSAQITRDFSGDLFLIQGQTNLKRLLLWDASTGVGRSGAAIHLAANTVGGVPTNNPANLISRAGFNRIEQVRVSNGDPAGAWSRHVFVDGSLYTQSGSQGVRDIDFHQCWFFGGSLANDTLDVTTGVHVNFSDCLMDPGATAATQGVTVDVNSVNVSFSNLDLIGSFTTHGTNVSAAGGNISGDVLIAADAVANFIAVGKASGALRNLSTTSTLLGNIAGTGGVICFGPATTDLRVAADGGGTAWMRANATQVIFGSLNNVPVILSANSHTGLTVSNADGSLVAAAGMGFYGHSAPAQPTAPVTLADVIAIIRGCGLSA